MYIVFSNSQLDGAKSYIVSNPLLDTFGLHIHSHFNIVLCIACQCAKIPSNLSGHMKTHGIHITSENQIALQELFETYHITNDTNIPAPPPKGPPVEGLQIHDNGFCCNFCSYCSPGRRAFQTHWSNHHNSIQLPTEDRSHTGFIQTFFNPLPQRYFEVNPLLAKVSSEDVYAIFIRDIKSNFNPFPTNPAINSHEIPPLLKVTDWHNHLQEYCSDCSKRKKLMTLTTLPTRPSKTGLDSLGDLVLTYLKEIGKLSKKMTLNMKCLLMECPRFVYRLYFILPNF